MDGIDFHTHLCCCCCCCCSLCYILLRCFTRFPLFLFLTMAKSKNHTNHNQSRKNHRNGIKKALPIHLHNSKRGSWLPALVNARRVRKQNQKAAIKARRERIAAIAKLEVMHRFGRTDAQRCFCFGETMIDPFLHLFDTSIRLSPCSNKMSLTEYFSLHNVSSALLPLLLSLFLSFLTMAKSKNHTNHNQSRKNHRNGIKKALPIHLHNSKRGSWLPALVNARRVRKQNQKAAIKARRERIAAIAKLWWVLPGNDCCIWYSTAVFFACLNSNMHFLDHEQHFRYEMRLSWLVDALTLLTSKSNYTYYFLSPSFCSSLCAYTSIGAVCCSSCLHAATTITESHPLPSRSSPASSYLNWTSRPYLVEKGSEREREREMEQTRQNDLREEAENRRAAARTMRHQSCVDCADRAVWTVTSAKHGCGVRNLIDASNPLTFWQSDGLVPHAVTLHFRELIPIACVEILTDADDESYAPKVVELRGGVQEGSYSLIATGELPAVVGGGSWFKLYAWNKNGWGVPDSTEEEDPRDCFFWCTTLQLRVLENYMKGRDCRIRALRVYAATECASHQELNSFQMLRFFWCPGMDNKKNTEKIEEAKKHNRQQQGVLVSHCALIG
eukprot:gene8207-5732_t